ncbi:hypothetical protein [Sulfurimonas sp.]
MVSLERMLFDYNEYMHHSGIYSRDIYMDERYFMLKVMEITLITMVYIYYLHPIVMRKLIAIKVNESTRVYLLVALFIVYTGYFYLQHEYAILLGVSIVTIVLYLIFTHKRLRRVREFIERFF